MMESRGKESEKFVEGREILATGHRFSVYRL